MPIAEYFSVDYAQARKRFRRAAEAAGAELTAFALPGHRGPAGEELAIDVARLGPRDATAALLVVSGTHGVEGFCGSGCQVGLLEDRFHEALPPSACVLVVHALNPYGFAWLRRVNEDGVDLNRNWIDFSKAPPSSAAYEEVHEWLVPEDWRGACWSAADAALAAYVEKHGVRAYQAAVSSGQYSRPTGLFYGGTRRTWSATTLERILQAEFATTAQHVAVLDLHTGLGPPAYGEPILIAATAADRERALQWYGPEVRDLAAGESVSAAIEGALPRGIQAALPGVAMTYLALEFGTKPIKDVVDALRADHWLHAAGATSAATRDAVRAEMLAAFYSGRPAWQAAVYGRTADFAYRACRGLG